MTIALAEFQRALAGALLADDPLIDAPEWLAGLATQPGFAVHRNTVLAGCVDALAAAYPAVVRLVGDEWFRAAAAVHARANPPAHPMLAAYGEGFPGFLAGFAPAAQLPYLAAVARVERMWTEAHLAADAQPMRPAALAALPPQALGGLRLAPHPSARWAWFDRMPIRTIWARNRDRPDAGAQDSAQADAPIHWRGEGVLLVRPRAQVNVHPLDPAGCAFLDACAGGAPLLQAALAASRATPDTDLARLTADLLDAGALAAPIPGAGAPPTGQE